MYSASDGAHDDFRLPGPSLAGLVSFRHFTLTCVNKHCTTKPNKLDPKTLHTLDLDFTYANFKVFT